MNHFYDGFEKQAQGAFKSMFTGFKNKTLGMFKSRARPGVATTVVAKPPTGMSVKPPAPNQPPGPFEKLRQEMNSSKTKWKGRAGMAVAGVAGAGLVANKTILEKAPTNDW